MFDENVWWKRLMNRFVEKDWWTNCMKILMKISKKVNEKLIKCLRNEFDENGQWISLIQMFEEWIQWKMSINKCDANVQGMNLMKVANE